MRLLTATATAIVALALGACGDSGGGGAAASGGGATTVTLKQIPGTGSVLVDSTGKALYAADQEANGSVRCTGPCTSFWLPLTVKSGKPTADGVDGTLGVIKRPDGTRQVTFGGKPLYRFSEDEPGKVNGDGFTDAFGGERFDWHVVGARGATSRSSSSPSAGY